MFNRVIDVFFFIDYEKSSYIGGLTVDDHDFCTQIVSFLQQYYNRSISEIGDLDVPLCHDRQVLDSHALSFTNNARRL